MSMETNSHDILGFFEFKALYYWYSGIPVQIFLENESKKTWGCKLNLKSRIFLNENDYFLQRKCCLDLEPCEHFSDETIRVYITIEVSWGNDIELNSVNSNNLLVQPTIENFLPTQQSTVELDPGNDTNPLSFVTETTKTEQVPKESQHNSFSIENLPSNTTVVETAQNFLSLQSDINTIQEVYRIQEEQQQLQTIQTLQHDSAKLALYQLQISGNYSIDKLENTKYTNEKCVQLLKEIRDVKCSEIWQEMRKLNVCQKQHYESIRNILNHVLFYNIRPQLESYTGNTFDDDYLSLILNTFAKESFHTIPEQIQNLLKESIVISKELCDIMKHCTPNIYFFVPKQVMTVMQSHDSNAKF